MSPVEDLEDSKAAQADRRQRMLEQVTAVSRQPKPTHIWPRGRADREVIDYVKSLVGIEGTVELWGFGRTATRQIRRAARRLQFFEGLAVSTMTAEIESGDEAPVRTGIQVGPPWSDTVGPLWTDTGDG